MIRYMASRLMLAVPVLLAVLTIVFLVVRVLPGDPATAALGDYASESAVEAMRERMGLNDPLPIQYLNFLGNLLRGDLGTSLINGQPVLDQVLYALPFTLQLTITAVIIGIVLGVPLGVYTAVNRNKLPDYIGRVISLAGLSVPAFYLGILLILVFAIQLRWLPAIGVGDPDDPLSLARHLILPALTLGLVMTASVTRLSRSAMLNVLRQDYVRTAKAKGLADRIVLLRHALRSALVPIVSLTGIWAASLIGDSVLTEVVFARPGLGRMMVNAIMQRDYTTLQSVMVIFAAFVVVINLITDLTYGIVDPRVRHG